MKMDKPTIGILFNKPVQKNSECWETSAGVIEQVEAIETALARLGNRSVRISFSGDLDNLLVQLRWDKVDIVFNLCESANEDPCLIGHPAAILELLQIPFTGSSALALMLSSDKLLSKQLFMANEIPTPKYTIYDGGNITRPIGLRFPVILKPRFQDPSIGDNQNSICRNSDELNQKAKTFYARYGLLLIEEYIDGQEFHVTLLGFPDPEILPIGKIDFSEFPADLYQIVGYRGKRDRFALEFYQRPQLFTDELPLQTSRTMRRAARKCFRVFMLRDYGQVNIRVDQNQRIDVLEVNANPCLRPDADFAVAAAQGDKCYPELIYNIIQSVLQRFKKHASHQAAS
jgi:D-alanine-D-alanine ligase